MKHNGTELLVLRPVSMVKSFTMVSAFVHKVNSKKMENVSTTQAAKLASNGMESNVLLSHVPQVLLTQTLVDAAKLRFLHVQLVHIGMVTDVYMSLTSAQQV